MNLFAIMNLFDVIGGEKLAIGYALPLTPALSLGERENSLQPCHSNGRKSVRLMQMAGGLLMAGLMGCMAGSLQAAPMVFQSTEQQTSLLELFTSEGCSSCPPAEVWFSTLKDDPGLWRDFVPVAFLVDYWNYLGWRDPWSKEDFSDRQRDYARAWGSENVYTPDSVLNGIDWHRWFWQRKVPAGGSGPNGVLKVASEDGVHWRVSYVPPETGAVAGVQVWQLYTSLLVSGVGSDVTAGENSGRHLNHDFVALSLTEQPLVSKTNELKGAFQIDEKLKPGSGRLALAVWVCRNGQTEPAQAVGGWLR
jgi:hypothetical protein